MKREQKMMIENNIIFQEISKSFIQEKEHLKKNKFSDSSEHKNELMGLVFNEQKKPELNL